jgi:hypothetical protein
VAWLLDVATVAAGVKVAVEVVAKLLLTLVVMILSLNPSSTFLRQGIKYFPIAESKCH